MDWCGLFRNDAESLKSQKGNSHRNAKIAERQNGQNAERRRKGNLGYFDQVGPGRRNRWLTHAAPHRLA